MTDPSKNPQQRRLGGIAGHVPAEWPVNFTGIRTVSKGLDIPDLLLQAHEEGNAVFFCGAGFSYAARLLGFQNLVDRLYVGPGTVPMVCLDTIREIVLPRREKNPDKTRPR